MRIVNEATKPPGKCLVSRDTEGPFFDTEVFARHKDPYMYIGVRWVEERAKELGFVPGDEVEALKDRLSAFDARFEQLEAFADTHTAHERASQALEAMTNGEGI